jgi:Zn-dependent membrane protease YugP
MLSRQNNPEGDVSACDVIEKWDETAYSGEGGRLDQLGDIVKETMESYGFDGVDVQEESGLMDDEGVPARYDPDDNTIYFDPDYLAGDSITPDEGVYLAMHEAIHAMDYLEDRELDVGEAEVASIAFGMSGEATDDCQSLPDSSGTTDTGGW